jgi:uncharacterized protein (TIGR02145 family)
MKKILKILLIMSIMVLTNCADVPSDLLEDANANKYSYCVIETYSNGENQTTCLTGPFTNSTCRGYLANECPVDLPPDNPGVKKICSSEEYDSSKEGCCNNHLVFNLASQRCENNIVEGRCGTDWYDLNSIFRCEDNILETACGEISYGRWYNAKDPNLRCNSSSYSPVLEIRCGDEWYNVTSTNLKCQSEVLTKCGDDDWYDATNTDLRCTWAGVQTRCGTGTDIWYSAINQRCGSNNIVENKCGISWYNAAISSLRCGGENSDVVETHCGGSWYDTTNVDLRCHVNEYNNEVLQGRCGIAWFLVSNQRCGEGNVIETKCGDDEWYDETDTDLSCRYYSDESKYFVHNKCGAANWFYPEKQRCENNVVETKCGNSWFEAANDKRCGENDVIETRCGNSWYDATNTNLRCQSYVVETKCGDDWYNANNTYLQCQSNVIAIKCGNAWYNPSSNYCVDNIVKPAKGEFTDARDSEVYEYVTIGSQTWMAENLMFESTNGLYNWATAMDIDASCNYSSCSSQIHLSNHQGICPDGWHIPTQDDWNTLSNSVSASESYGSNVDGKHLKAVSGWSTNGLDTYGFTALPNDGNIAGRWWSASVSSSNDAYYRQISASESAEWNIESKTSTLSVRCVKN